MDSVKTRTAKGFPTPHAFFTRQGGVTQGEIGALNCGSSADTPENIAENRARAMTHIGKSPEQLCLLKQIHSNHVVTIDEPFQAHAIEGDAMVTTHRNLVLGVLTADCTPILLSDPKQSVIGIIHAGWKPAFSGIILKTIEAMHTLGAQDITAAIGPCIQQPSYEVGPEFYDRFETQDQRFFIPSQTPEHWMFDLPGFTTSQLEQAGINNIINTQTDTYSNSKDWFSYRRATHQGTKAYGNFLSAIWL